MLCDIMYMNVLLLLMQISMDHVIGVKKRRPAL